MSEFSDNLPPAPKKNYPPRHPLGMPLFFIQPQIPCPARL